MGEGKLKRKIIDRKSLFPVYLRPDHINILIVGEDYDCDQIIGTIYKSSPKVKIRVVGEFGNRMGTHLKESYPNTPIEIRPYDLSDLDEMNVLVIAIEDEGVCEKISQEAHVKGLLVNIINQPDKSDFHLQNVLTKETREKNPDASETEIITDKKWTKIVKRSAWAFIFMIVGYFVISLIPFKDLGFDPQALIATLDKTFYLMILVGFLAQLIDGALGMGYGVISTAALLSLGIPLPSISGGVHTAEMFSSAVSGYNHYKFGNINKKLLKNIAIPGVIGAILGAVLLSILGRDYEGVIKPIIAVYTMIMGIKILTTAFNGRIKGSRKVRRAGVLGFTGGLLDSFGGGGWGPLVTTTLISKGKTPRYVIGTVSLSEFFVTLASSLTFFTFLGLNHWQVILGLIFGGVIAAPIAARLAGKLPVKTMLIAVGCLVIIWSLNVFIKSLT